MKWKGREGSGNIEDRRGMSTGRMAVGGGIGTIVVLLIVLLLGGDPVKLLDSMQQGGPATETGQIATTPEEDEMAQFVSVVLKDTETVWSKIFEQSGSTYRQPKLVFSETRFSLPAVLQVLPADLSIARVMKMYILTSVSVTS